jgi:zinc protease
MTEAGYPFVRHLIALLFTATLAAGLSGHAQAGLFNPESFTLDNGMQVVVVPDHRAPVVVHMVWYKVGAADEPPGKSGIAHFLEHLMFKGTDKLAPGEFSKTVAANGGRDNAFTSQDYTAYFQTIARDRLELVMSMEADRMVNLQFGEKDMVTEREVVLEERRQRTDSTAQGQFREQAQAALYLAHPYGTPIVGWEAEIKRLDVNDALAFYRRFYAPNNAILVVAGDVTAEQLRPLAEKFYGVIPANPDVRQADLPHEPPHRAARRLTHSDPRVAEPSWQRMYLADSVSWGDQKNTVALQILSNILGAGSTSRLYRNLAVDTQTALSVGSWYSGVNRGPGSFGLYASPAEDTSMQQLEEAIDAELQKVIADGVSEVELKRAKTGLLADAVYMRDSLSRGARVFGSALSAGVTIEEVESWPDRVRAVTAADVRRAAEAVFQMERSVTATLLPGERS